MTSKILFKPPPHPLPVSSAAVRSKVVSGPCFIMQYSVSFLFLLQSSRLGRGNRLLYCNCILAVVWLSVICVSSSRRHGLVCDSGISWSCSLVFIRKKQWQWFIVIFHTGRGWYPVVGVSWKPRIRVLLHMHFNNLNPFKSNGFFHSYKLDQSFSVKGCWVVFCFYKIWLWHYDSK